MRCIVASGLLASSLACGAAAPPPPSVALREVARNLTHPLAVVSPGDGSGRLFIVEKEGLVRILGNGAVLPAPFLDIRDRVAILGERGLLGLAFHPRFASNRRFYVFYTMLPDSQPNEPEGGALRISSFLASAVNPDMADILSETELVTVRHGPFSNHNGGQLAFGPDGLLYFGTGDGGGLDPDDNAQNPAAALGKVSRIDVDSPGAARQMYAYGVRNPWRFSFDRLTGDFYLGDVGQSTIEEIDFLPAATAPGTNFGWKVFEGSQCFTPPSGCSLAGHTPPILEYRHDAAGGNSVTGGFVYRGWKSAAFRGYYVYGDFVSNRVWAAIRDGGTWSTFVILPPGGALSGIASFGEGEDGELYVASYINGRVYALDAPGPAAMRARFDFNGDAKADIVWQHADGRAAQWLMDGTVQAGGRALIPAGTGWSAKHVRDFSADGKADILWERADGTSALWLMNGTAQAGGARLRDAGSGWQARLLGDFNADRKADILWQHTNGSVELWLMNGAGAQDARALFGMGTGWSAKLAGDFDGDGKSDILWQHTDGRVAMWLMDGLAQVGGARLRDAGSGWTPILLGDFDGDGMADILWQHTDGSTEMWLMDGAAARASRLLVGAGTGWAATHTGDIDGDGRSDIAWRRNDGTVAYWLMNGTAQAGGARLFDAASDWTVVRLADFNGDAKADVLAQHVDGRVKLIVMDRGPAFERELIPALTGWMPIAAQE